MTRTKMLLGILASGSNLSAHDLAVALGWTTLEVKACIRGLRGRGIVLTNPATYSISDTGLELQRRVPVSSPEKIKRVSARRRARKEWVKSSKGQEILALARSVPNSVFALGERT